MIKHAALVQMLFAMMSTFVFAMAITPLITKLLYKCRLGKPVRSASIAPIMHALHAHKAGTPTMGGIVVWLPVLLLTIGFVFLGRWIPFFSEQAFLSRSQTWLPLGVLIASALVGIADDYLNVRGIGAHGGGIRFRHRLLLYLCIAAVGAWWFTVKLGWDILHVPFVGDVTVGPWYALVFIIVIVATSFSVNQTDGLDGLAGGVLLTSFGAYAVIALIQGKEDLAAFCTAIVGGLLAFLWFNIPPARFFMGDTGAMSLGVTLGVVALLTNQALLLPVIGLVFVLESLSSIIQISARKLVHKKVFLSSPLHHHLEAKGWGEPKVVMRAWVVSLVVAGVGLALAVLDKEGLRFL